MFYFWGTLNQQIQGFVVLAPNSCLPRSTMMIKDMVPRPVLERLSLQPSFTNKAVEDEIWLFLP